MLTKARAFAIAAHESIGQVRKGDGEPYWKHPVRVAEMLVGQSDALIAAAYLHDVVEDVSPENPTYGPDRILEEFGPRVLGYVMEVTNVFTKASYPAANRRTRHSWENLRIAGISDKAKLLKLADRLDNVSDLSFFRTGFAHKYAEETIDLLKAIGYPDGGHEFRVKINEAIRDY
jgi:(p)ppGpp synthase/HD superfamily hydrolase